MSRRTILSAVVAIGAAFDSAGASSAPGSNNLRGRSADHNIVDSIQYKRHYRHLEEEVASASPHVEIDGLVVMEMESQTLIPDWVHESDVPGFTGWGYYRMDGNAVTTGDPNGRTSFFILINNPGTYRLALRSYKNNEDTTWSNDCYTKMVGHPDYQGTDTKTYMYGPSFEWSWSTTHQITHDDQRTPFYDLEAGIHELQISGRSKNFHIDRVVLYQTGLISTYLATMTYQRESPRLDASSTIDVIGDYNFTASASDFTYQDDIFRDTSNAFYARGSWSASSARLNVVLGGKDDLTVGPISGGFKKVYTLDTYSDVRVEFRYRLNFKTDLVDGEDVEVLCNGDDGTLRGQGLVDYVDKFYGADNITAGLSDWFTGNVYLGQQSIGEHEVAIGGYMSMKTTTAEIVIFIDDVYITTKPAPTQMPTSVPTVAPTTTMLPTTSPTVAPTSSPVRFEPVLMDDEFTTSADGFAYEDNVFRNADQSLYAWGWYSSNSNGQKLRVSLGGKDDTLIETMSGGYKKSYMLGADANVVVEFRYRVIFDSDLEDGEDVEILCSVDGHLFGQNMDDFVDKFYGVDATASSGWKSAVVSLGSQSFGWHEFAVGAFLSSKNESTEIAKIDFDDVYMTATEIF